MKQPRKTVRKAQIPDLDGVELENARLMLRNLGFEPSAVTIRYEEAYAPEGHVTRQAPPVGALVGVDEPIELVVSRRSLSHHLPQIYQKQGAMGGDFLGRFLTVFDHLYATLEHKLDRLHLYFDPLQAPAPFLDWLAGWVALSLDQDWPESKKRKLIKEAISMYGLRGTVRGLKIFLHIFTGVEPKIMENKWPYRGFRIGEVRIGLDSIVLPPVRLSDCFMVEVPAEFSDASDETILKIHDIIRMEKPAQTTYYLTFAAAKRDDALQAFRIGLGRVGLEESGVVADERTRRREMKETE
ncbi:PASTA domain-containing protein [Myxococcota bacterium]|nr:PASTA domain-containing protein [Myxococcota bacterium]MBU1431678.1 PASTA domain-containing protein [Myxococcota bacterium]MBU1900023.1 PASTA domain-containing protein [Myxococcota bacterium]